MTPEERKEAQYQFIAETSIDPADEEDIEVILERCREVRKIVAARRQGRNEDA